MDESIKQHLGRLFEKTSWILSEITAVTEAGLLKYSEDTGVLKVSWRRWLMSRSKIEKLSTALCDVRRDIYAAVTLLTA